MFTERLLFILGLACILIVTVVTLFHTSMGSSLTDTQSVYFDLRLTEISDKIDRLDGGQGVEAAAGKKEGLQTDPAVLQQLLKIEGLLMQIEDKQASLETKFMRHGEGSGGPQGSGSKTQASQNVDPEQASQSIDFERYSQLIADLNSLSSQTRELAVFRRDTIGKLLMLQEKAASILPEYEIPPSGSLFLGGGLREGEDLPAWRKKPDGSLKKFAYVTLIGGVKKGSQGHLGFLVNAASTAWALRQRKSIGEVVVMVDFADDSTSLPREQEELLEQQGVKIQYLQPWGGYQANFVTVEFQKMRIWEMEEYEVVIFFDGDLMVHGTLDPYFATSHDLFLRGRSEPINAGLMVVHPDRAFFQEKIFPWIEWRLSHTMLVDKGWGGKFPITQFPVRKGWISGDWHSMVSGPAVQGLLYLLYEMEHKPHSLIDLNKITYWDEKGQVHEKDHRVALDSSLIPLAATIGDNPIMTQFYSHFTSKKKPWMVERPFKDANVERSEGWRVDWWAWRCEQVGVSFEDLKKMKIQQIGFFANHKMVRKQPGQS